MYNNPYDTKTKHYSTYRYFCKKYPDKSYEEIKQITENNWGNNTKRHYTTHTKSFDNTNGKPTYQELPYPTHNPNGIIKSDERYIYYIDKVWSKGQDRYLKPIKDSKGLYCLLWTRFSYTPRLDGERKYEKYYITK